jgi:hypothetical protein
MHKTRRLELSAKPEFILPDKPEFGLFDADKSVESHKVKHLRHITRARLSKTALLRKSSLVASYTFLNNSLLDKKRPFFLSETELLREPKSATRPFSLNNANTDTTTLQTVFADVSVRWTGANFSLYV